MIKTVKFIVMLTILFAMVGCKEEAKEVDEVKEVGRERSREDRDKDKDEDRERSKNDSDEDDVEEEVLVEGSNFSYSASYVTDENGEIVSVFYGPNASSIEQMRAIVNSHNLLAFEAGTTEYNEARDWLITTARDNGIVISDENAWIADYKTTLQDNGGVELLSEMEELSISELVKGGAEYNDMMGVINEALLI